MRLWDVVRAPERLRRVWREAETDADMHFDGYVAWREHLERLGISSFGELNVLDIGCGDRAPLSLLFASDGARVVSLDVLPIALGLRRPRMWIALARSEGPVRASRALLRDLLHTFRYWRRLAERNQKPLPFAGVRLVQGDAAALPFAESTFDLVVSSAVWEHLPDVARATQEVNRVLRPDGVAVIQIALFPALEGGHHPGWHASGFAGPPRMRPWDHLYADRNDLPTYLNEWQESQYRDVLGRYLDVVEWEDGEMRGAEYLSGRVIAERPELSKRDLLLSSLTVWARIGDRRVLTNSKGLDEGSDGFPAA